MNNLALIEATKAGNYEKVEALIHSGADINQQDEQGWTALNYAAGAGDLALVKLLVEQGAYIFKTGRDLRTPCMVALAAGRAPVVEYLRKAEENHPGEKPPRLAKKYCKAYHLKDLRSFPAWSERPTNEKPPATGETQDEPSPNDHIVFIHQDYTVTESMWHNENVIFDNVNAAWIEFCTDSLGFRIPDPLEWNLTLNI